MYLGEYFLKEIHSGSDTVLALEQPVHVVFRKPEFSLQLDPAEPESLRVICDMVGTYVLGNGVMLQCAGIGSVDSCADSNLYPCGVFGLDQTTDTLRLIQDITVETVRRIKKLSLLPLLPI
jgi:hypothetical protein